MFSINLDVYINASREKVFDTVSLPDLLVNWWPEKCSGERELGEKYNLYFSEQYNWYGKVCELVKNERFFISMTDADDDWNPTTFGFVLKDHKEGTMVELRHEDWQVNNHHFRNTTYFWALLLKGLKDYLEKGIILEFKDRG